MKYYLSLFLFLFCLGGTASGQMTIITVSVPDTPQPVDPMIYGQMLEDCNDNVIYGGLINPDGSEHPEVATLLQPLEMPVVRWPAGTYIHEYDWKKGIGPKDQRPLVKEFAWKGIETNQFGTDEFLQWCRKINTEPYINFNMGNDPLYGGSLGDALSWIEYVNGTEETTYGKKRAANGHPTPYQVKYWGIGNENYGPWGRHTSETADVYSKRLDRWAGTIRHLWPDLRLLGVGHTYHWNDTVLTRNGAQIDLLTIHFYMTARLKDGKLQQPENTLYAPAKIEHHLRKNAELLQKANALHGREHDPIRFSIDEWNCRHSVYNGKEYQFTRNDPRRQFDIAVTAGMLNVFIRQSPAVGMGNYIFPVNGHGLIRTINDSDAYRTPTYYVFELYRKYMTGSVLNAEIQGPAYKASLKDLSVEGDISAEFNTGDIEVQIVDAAAVKSADGLIRVTLVNRSHKDRQNVKINLPQGYTPVKQWTLASQDIHETNHPEQRNRIQPKETVPASRSKTYTCQLPPCAFVLLECKPVN